MNDMAVGIGFPLGVLLFSWLIVMVSLLHMHVSPLPGVLLSWGLWSKEDTF
jgi:hypothetical protein